MDECRCKEVADRLSTVEAKLDQVVTFTATLERLFGAWMAGGRGKLLTALAKTRGGTG